MSNLTRTWVAGLMAAAVAVCGHAQDLKAVKGIYEKNSEMIRSNSQPKFESLQQQYVKSLEALKTRAQSRGDFKMTKAAADESERFQKAKSLPAAPDESELPEIKALQLAYVSQYNRLEADMTVQLGVLTEKYAHVLDRQLKELTKAGKLDAATAVNQELEAAQTAVKGYAEALAALKGGPTATNSMAAVASRAGATAQATPSWKTDAKKSGGDKELYLVIDLSGGKDGETYPVSVLADVPQGGWTDEYKTDKLVLRRLEPGTFEMGSPENEPGRDGSETCHRVTLTQGFYIGVFEVTQRQWELVTSNTPCHLKGPVLPVETVSYNEIRGSSVGADWPATNSVDEVSFMGALRAKTGLATLDLPTEAQWEYACRAGTDRPYAEDLGSMAWYKVNSGGATHPAGQRLPNAWGLYDMHGNAWEWCLDWKGEYPAGSTIDPAGAASGSDRVLRGGSWGNNAQDCRSAGRYSSFPCYRFYFIGFRAAMTLP